MAHRPNRHSLFLVHLKFLKWLERARPLSNGGRTSPHPHDVNICCFFVFQQISKEYGNVFSLQYFWKKMVVVNGYEAVKEALISRSEDTADRPRLPIFEKAGYTGETKGIVIANYGNSWRDHRRFTLMTLRNFGMGKKSLEERVTDEAQCLCDAFVSKEGRPFNPHYLVNNAISNVICSIAFGDRFDYDDQKFQQLLHLFDAALKGESGLLAQILNEIPILTNIPWLIDQVIEPERKIIAFLKEIISEHKKTWNPDDVRDFIDAYLLEMEKANINTSSFTNRLVLEVIMNRLYHYIPQYKLCISYLSAKVQEEIDQVIGRERKPTMGDVLNMPYTNAVIHEVQRFGDIIPLSLPHMTYRDVELQGYFLPKGTQIITNLSSVLKDPQVWEKPFQFYPKHFLDESGKFVKREAFIPFSAGRRVCLGEQLARMELFLFFTTLLQQLMFEIPSDHPRPEEKAVFALTSSPQPYNICAKARM
ncbi:hypothetical protein GDO81_018102 [Engystomops pustulosus]|uniref:Uncharacterized protein n=1 Tax=Engystomops pustulosus TaxID=76066 RepID=A0AAV7AEL4_ENGPU|nr:hypothetical protein GDO81_018102 [Engystomops pustulosus]